MSGRLSRHVKAATGQNRTKMQAAWLVVLSPKSAKKADKSQDRCRIRATRERGACLKSAVSTRQAMSVSSELIEDGCWDVEIIDPDGRVFTSFEVEAA
jgi:hypothetical protein